MCVGVERGFAGKKLSGSIKRYGIMVVIINSPNTVNANPIASLIEKYA